MTYNIHHGASAHSRLDLQAVADVISAHEVEIVGLQEVDRHWSERSAFADQVRQLAGQLDMNYFFAPIYDLPPPAEGAPRRQYGLAILSTFPIVERQNLKITRLSSIDDHPSPKLLGGFPSVTLEVGDTPLHVFNTHLDYRSDPTVRRTQVQDMLEHTAGVAGPKVLLGDLNAPPEAPELRPLWETFTDAWDRAGRGEGYTYPSGTPAKRIDYILVTPDVEVDSVAVVEAPASDHHPVMAELTLPAASSK